MEVLIIYIFSGISTLYELYLSELIERFFFIFTVDIPPELFLILLLLFSVLLLPPVPVD